MLCSAPFCLAFSLFCVKAFFFLYSFYLICFEVAPISPPTTALASAEVKPATVGHSARSRSLADSFVFPTVANCWLLATRSTLGSSSCLLLLPPLFFLLLLPLSRKAGKISRVGCSLFSIKRDADVRRKAIRRVLDFDLRMAEGRNSSALRGIDSCHAFEVG